MTELARIRAILFAVTVATATSSCDRPPTAPPPGPGSGPTTLTSIKVTGPASIAPGENAHYTATAHYASGSSEDVTAIASWTPPASASSPIRLTSAGVASATRPGENLVTASYGGKSGSLRVFVLPVGTFALTGTVSEADGSSLSGVTVEVVSGTGQGLQTVTQSQGLYALYGVAGLVALRASADGFTPQTHEIVVTSNDATEAFALTPAAAPADVSGIWTLTVSPSPGCRPGLPDIARQRTYQVRLTQQGTRLQMGISGPTLRVFNPDWFDGAVLGSSILLSFPGDTNYGEWSTPDLYDQLSPTEAFGFSGRANGTVTDAEIRATMYGDLVYWNARTFEPTWYCRATDHAVTLRR